MPKRRDPNAPFWMQMREAERHIINFALEHGVTLRGTAQLLGISSNFLGDRMRLLGLPIPDSTPGPKPGTPVKPPKPLTKADIAARKAAAAAALAAQAAGAEDVVEDEIDEDDEDEADDLEDFDTSDVDGPDDEEEDDEDEEEEGPDDDDDAPAEENWTDPDPVPEDKEAPEASN